MSSPKVPLVTNLVPKVDQWLRDHVSPGSKTVVDVDHVFTGTANREERIRHRLSSVPVGFRVAQQSWPGSVYVSADSTPHTRTHLYLKSSTAGLTVRLEVF